MVFVPGMKFSELVMKVGASEDTLVIEIGYSGGMRMPSDFFCLARNLGLNYWISPSLSGSYDSPIVADIEDITSILQQSK
jgi:hypothetical protein